MQVSSAIAEENKLQRSIADSLVRTPSQPLMQPQCRSMLDDASLDRRPARAAKGATGGAGGLTLGGSAVQSAPFYPSLDRLSD